MSQQEPREIFPVQFNTPRPGGSTQWSTTPPSQHDGGEEGPKVQHSPAPAYAASSPSDDAKEMFPVQGLSKTPPVDAPVEFGSHVGDDPSFSMEDLRKETALESEHPEEVPDQPVGATAADERVDAPTPTPDLAEELLKSIQKTRTPEVPKPPRPATKKATPSATSAKPASAEKASKDDPEDPLVF